MIALVREARDRLARAESRLAPRPRLAATLALLTGAVYAGLLGIAHAVPRYDCIVFPFFAALIVWLVTAVRGKALFLALVGASTLLSLGVLVHLWTTGHEGRSAVLLGIVPYSDAGAFYADAERMVYGLRFGESSRRPLYVAVAGAILRWFGDDLRGMLAIQTVAYGAAMGFVVRESLRVHGRAAATVVLVVVYFWVRRFTGFVATEALAFPLGALAFGLLVRVAEQAEEKARAAALAFGAAMLAVTLALVARPGALLVVPALLLWTRWAFRGRWRAIAFGSGTVGVVLALLATRAVTARLSSGATFGDYPGILYALVHRGELFQAITDHPELVAVEPAQRGQAILAILMADVRRDPSLLVVGPADAFVSFLGGAHGLFSFIWTNPDDHVLENGPLVRQLIADHGYVGPVLHWVRELGVFSFVNAIVMGALGAAFACATVVGLVRLVRRVRRSTDPRVTLVLIVMGGVLASSVFAPTWIGEGMQMETAVFAFVPMALALGLFRKSESARRDEAPLGRLTVVTALVPAVLGLLVVAACAWPRVADRSGCAPGVLSARLNPSTRTVLRSAAERTPNEQSLALNLEFLARHNQNLVESVKAVARTGDVVEVVYDACEERTRIVFGSPELLPAVHTWATLGFEPQKEPMLGRVSPFK